MTTKTMPKSLHTVTVLVRIASYIRQVQPGESVKDCVRGAAIVLGYIDAPDAYGLQASAIKQMQA